MNRRRSFEIGSPLSRAPNVTASRYSGESKSRYPRRQAAAERLEQSQVGQALVPVGRDPAQLVEHALAGRLRHERRAFADERFRLGVEAEAELVLDSHGAQQAEGVVVEDARRDDADDAALEIGPPVVRVERSHRRRAGRRSR